MLISSSRKITIIKWVDRWLGRFLVWLLPAADTESQSIVGNVDRVLFVRPGGLGDALLLLPVIEHFAKRFPLAKIDILAEARNAAAYSFLQVEHHVELYTDPTAFWRLSRRKYDVVIDTEQWYRLSAAYAYLLRPQCFIGFATNERAQLLTNGVDYRLEDYELESFFRLLEPMGIDVSPVDRRLGLSLGSGVATRVDSLLGRDLDCRLIAIFPGASVPEKCWATDNYCSLVAALQTEGFRVVIVGGESEVSVADEIAAEAGCDTLAGKTTLIETAGILSKMDLLITGDSALLHLAASLRVPTVSIFGPSSPVKWAPRGDSHKYLQKKFDCVPCARYGHIPPCPYGVRCLAGIGPDDVLVEALRLVDAEDGK